ncbi:MAG: sodium ion-translocating decarboxylase subunit beta [Bacteroidaceae bacterium]|nr:sodium ion-translocating decarboxylase subunit beta [Bacteroidaceae bacterium]
MTKFLDTMGFNQIFSTEGGWKYLVMLVVACFLLYLAIKKQYEPMLLLPIAFGMLLSTLPGANMFHTEMWNEEFLKPAR